jgi:hypothetical protein
VVSLGAAAVRVGVALGFLAVACANDPLPAVRPASSFVATPPASGAEPRASLAPPVAKAAAAPPACGVNDSEAVPLPELAAEQAPSSANLRSWVHVLAGPELHGRKAGTDDARRSARLIADYFAKLDAGGPPGEHCQPFSFRDGLDYNAVLHFPAGGAACKWLIVGAHYDALGPDAKGRVRPGADDNATGVSILLELARSIDEGSVHPRSNLAFVAFGAEETDLSGSSAYVKDPSVPLDRVALMINVDMAGRRPAGAIGFAYQAYGPELRRTTELVKSAGARTRVPLMGVNLGDRSDSSSFAAHAPAVFFSTMVHPDYHRASDTPDRVDFGQVERGFQLVRELVESIDCDGKAVRRTQ